MNRIKQLKIYLVVAAVVIAIASLAVSHFLIRDIASEERNNMQIWAQALNVLNNADETTDLSLVLQVIQSNNTIPVIVMDSKGRVTDYRNVSVNASSEADSVAFLTREAQRMYASGRFVKIQYGDSRHGNSDFQLVCYDESLMLKRLAGYPYIQLSVVLIFVLVAIFALLMTKKAEQNKVWVGLSKETAHQLGTPISSLMAWIEIFREMYPDDDMIPEMDKDVKRLQLIADRFSKIGSQPELVPTHLKEVVGHVVDYMDKRTSKTVTIAVEYHIEDVLVLLCPQLFEWVIENLCKNAVDAMGGSHGSITITAYEENERICLDITDTGKGIKKKDVGSVFTPGFTTKKRGWGLGLSLAKRIIEEYHHGHIFVKNTEVGRGTTFCIQLDKMKASEPTTH